LQPPVSASRAQLPNALSMIRLLGTPILFWLVQLDSPAWFIAVFIILGLTDFFDGLLARRLGLASNFGAMLDSVADIVFYGSAAALAFLLFPDYLLPNLAWIVATIVLLLLTAIIPRLRLGHYLFIHTHLSRFAGALVFFAVPASFLFDTTWLIRAILLIYAASFLESMWIILRYGAVDPDTRSAFALRKRQRSPS